jgi:tetratricopeptide (TPR) repeat protein
MTNPAGTRSARVPAHHLLTDMTTTLNRHSWILITVMFAVAVAVLVVATGQRGAGEPMRITPAQRAAAAPLVTDVPSPGLTTKELIGRYSAAVASSPDDPAAYDNLAFAQMQMAREDGDPGWYAKADRLLHRALALAPNDISALGGLGSLALSRHDFTGAVAYGRRALALQPSSSQALGVLVDAQVELGRYGAAARTLQRMLNARPDLSSYARASYLLELDGHAHAAHRAMVEAVRSGASAKENVAWAQVQLGNLDFNHGRYRKAEASYAAALRTYPNFVHALAARAKLAAANGHLETAARLYSAVVRRYPLPAYVIALGDAQEASGDRRASARSYGLVRAEEALYAANGVNVDAELALFDADHGGNPEAALARARAVAHVQHSVGVQDVLAWTLFRAGHPRAALAAANRALARGTQDAGMLFHRGVIEAALQMRSAARRDLWAALRVNPGFSVLHAPVARRLLEELS